MFLCYICERYYDIMIIMIMIMILFSIVFPNELRYQVAENAVPRTSSARVAFAQVAWERRELATRRACPMTWRK